MAVNWDRLNVGRMDLNHSEGFFGISLLKTQPKNVNLTFLTKFLADKRHLEHERLEDLLQGEF